MGQFLAIGIVTKCGAAKERLQKHNIVKEELINQMMIKNHFEPTIYDFSETEDYYLFKLQDKVFENQLIPFLEQFYPLAYPSDNSQYIDSLAKLKDSKPTKWLQLADDKSHEAFQLDNYGEPDHIYFDKPFNPYVEIFSTSVILSLEGKILMEMYGRQFNFFRL